MQIMDSMDWFDPGDQQAEIQAQALLRALKPGGKILLRSAGLTPWYISVFEKHGFATKRVGARLPGTCIDRSAKIQPLLMHTIADVFISSRVNMYASTWICTKVEVQPEKQIGNLEKRSPRSRGRRLSTLEEIDIGEPMIEEYQNVEE